METETAEKRDFYHQPVLLNETEEYLITDNSGIYVDGTLGGGGHSESLLKKYPRLRVVGLDWDEAAISEAAVRLEPYRERSRIIRENFKNIKRVLEEIKIPAVDGVLLDLGLSSRQLDDVGRGFSFESPGLDMRMDTRLASAASTLVNTLDADELANLFYTLGEERFSRPISRLIVREREKGAITSGVALASLVERVKKRQGRIHPATKVFQALRIAVNRELENLAEGLTQLPLVLKPGGRVVVISYHSLEDRMVKHNFKDLAREGTYRLLTKKVIVPGQDEIKNNPRSRSAKLRAAERR